MASENFELNQQEITVISESSATSPNPFPPKLAESRPPLDFESIMQGAAPPDATSEIFTAGRFTVGESGTVRFEFAAELFQDSELGIFNLSGLENIDPTSAAFLQTATERVLSQSPLGHILLRRASKEIAGTLAVSIREVTLNPNEQFAILFLPQGSFEQPGSDFLCSIPAANLNSSGEFGRLKTEQTFGMIWRTLDLVQSGLVFRMMGATGDAALLDCAIDIAWSVETEASAPAMDVNAPIAIAVEPVLVEPDLSNSVNLDELVAILPEAEASEPMPVMSFTAMSSFSTTTPSAAWTASILWRNTATGDNELWRLNADKSHDRIVFPSTGPGAWQIQGATDFNRDGHTDLLWRHLVPNSGVMAIWQMLGANIVRTSSSLLAVPDMNWRIGGIGDFNQDGRAEILWRNQQSGEIAYWILDESGENLVSSVRLNTPIVDANWVIQGVGDFNRDGKPDLLWRNISTGEVAVWLMTGALGNQIASGVFLMTVADLNWQIQGCADFNGDGQADILWRNTVSGETAIWQMRNPNNLQDLEAVYFSTRTGTEWYALPFVWNTALPTIQIRLPNNSTSIPPVSSVPALTGNITSVQAVRQLLMRLSNQTTQIEIPVRADRSFDVTPAQLQQMNLGQRLTDGTYTVIAGVTDINNTRSLDTSFTFRVDRTALRVTLDLPSDQDTGRSNQDNVTRLKTLTFIGQTEPGSQVRLSENNIEIGQGIAASDGSWQVTVGNLKEGSQTISAIATDIVGNSTTPATLTIVVDTQIPGAPRNMFATFEDATVTIAGNMDVGSTVRVADDQQNEWEAAIGHGVWSISVPVPPTGVTRRFTAIATDQAGNVSPVSSPFLVKVEVAIPTNLQLDKDSDTGSSQTDRQTQDTTPTILGNADAGVTVSLFRGTQLIGEGTADSTGAWRITTQPLPEGVTTITARARNQEGKTSQFSRPLAITIDNQAPNAPLAIALAEGSDTGRNRGDWLTRIDTPTITGTAEANATVQLFNGTEFLGEAVTDALGKWAIDVEEPLEEGVATLRVIAIDPAGNLSTSTPITLTVDLQPPAAPTGLSLVAGSDSGISATDRLTSVSSPTIAGSASPNLLVQLFRGTIFLGQTNADSMGAWQITIPFLQDGTHTLTAVAYDDAANCSLPSESLQITVEATPPDLSLLSVFNNAEWSIGERLVGSLINIGTPITAITYRITLPNATSPIVTTTVPVAADGTFNAALNFTGLTVGQSYLFNATATGLAGNSQTRSLSFTLGSGTMTALPPTGNTVVSSYVERLRLILTEACLVLTGNQKVALTQVRDALVEVGRTAERYQFQSGMAGILQDLFALAIPLMTQAQAKQIGQSLAFALSQSQTVILLHVMQAKLLVTACQVVALRDHLPTTSNDTELSRALKQLAQVYLATVPVPTQPTQAGESPNLLRQIWQTASQSGFITAATRLAAQVQGTQSPVQAIRMVSRLIVRSQQTPITQMILQYPELSGSIVNIAFAYARLNPVRVTESTLLAKLPFQQLYQATEAEWQAEKPSLTAFYAGFPGLAAQRTLVNFQAALLDQIKTRGLLSASVAQDPLQIHNAMAMATWIISPRLSNLGSGQVTNQVTTNQLIAASFNTPTTTESSNLIPVVPYLPAPGTAQFGPGGYPEYSQSPWDSFYESDGRPKYYPFLLRWRIHVPVFSSQTLLYQKKSHAPNGFDSFSVDSYGGVQIRQIDPTPLPNGDQRYPITYGYFPTSTAYGEGREEINSYFDYSRTWKPEYGYGYLEFLGPVFPDTPLPEGSDAMGLGANGGRQLPTAKDGLPDPFRPIPQMPSNPPVSPPLNLPIGLVPGDPISPGDKTRDLPSGGITSLDDVDPTRYDGAPPNFLPDSDNDPNACKPRALSKPISDMDELEILLEVLSRVPCQVGKELRQQVKEVLSNPVVLGIMLLVLIVGTIFGGLIFGAILAVVGFVGDAQELAKFFQALFEAKEKNREDKLNEAAVALGVLLASYGAGNMGKLLDALKVFKGGMLKVGGQGISGATKLVDVLGVEAAAGLLKRFKSAGNYRRLEELSQAIEAYPRIMDAMKKVASRQPGAAGKATEVFLEFGSEAFEILMRRGNPRSLSTGLNAGSKGLGENLEAWIERLAQVSPQEGAKILDGLKYANQLRDTIRKPIVGNQGGGAIEPGRNIGFVEGLDITIPGIGSIQSSRGKYIAVSGTDEYVGALPVPQNPIFVPGSPLGQTRTNLTDSEFKILDSIAKAIQQKIGTSDIRDNSLTAQRAEITGTIVIFSERMPCGACAPLLAPIATPGSWKDIFPRIEVKVIHGPESLR